MYIMVEYYILVTVIAAIGSFIGSSQCIRSAYQRNLDRENGGRRVTFKEN